MVVVGVLLGFAALMLAHLDDVATSSEEALFRLLGVGAVFDGRPIGVLLTMDWSRLLNIAGGAFFVILYCQKWKKHYLMKGLEIGHMQLN